MFPFLNTYRLYFQIAAAALILSAGLYWHHKVYVSGVAAVQQADAVALQAAKAVADKETARLTKRAEDASHEHDKDLADLRLYRVTHPVHVGGGLCHNSNNSIAGLPGIPAPDFSHANTGPSPGDVQPVSSGNSGRDDIGPLLDLLAGRADKLSAQLREYQNR